MTSARMLMAMMLSAVTSSVASAQPTASYPPAWPRAGAKLLIENDRGAAYDVTFLTNQPSILHQHRYPFVGLDLETASIKVMDVDGTAHLFPAIKNNMWFLPGGATHREMSITTPPRHIVAIDIKDKSVPESQGDAHFPTNVFAGFQRKVLENDRVIIWDCAWVPGATSSASFQSRDMFVAFAEGGDLSVSEGGAPARILHYDAGQAAFFPGGHERSFGSVTGTIHAMLVQIK